MIAVAKGYGLAWKHLSSRSQVSLNLVPEENLRGKVVISENKPIAKVKVCAVRFTQLDQLACPNEARCQYPNMDSSGFLDMAGSGIPVVAETDDEGRFVLGGLPNNVRVLLLIDYPRFVKHEGRARKKCSCVDFWKISHVPFSPSFHNFSSPLLDKWIRSVILIDSVRSESPPDFMECGSVWLAQR